MNYLMAIKKELFIAFQKMDIGKKKTSSKPKSILKEFYGRNKRIIKCNKKGEITFKGNVPDLMTDLSVIARKMRELFMEKGMSKDEAEEGIKHAVEVGFWTEEELTEE